MKLMTVLVIVFGVICPWVLMAQIANDQVHSIETIVVTANRHSQDVQQVSSSISALTSEHIEQAEIDSIIALEQVVVGLKVASSGEELRPAMRGARTNEVGVAGTGIAEQVVGIFHDDIYLPTTTAGMGALVDIERIEVLRGPQGTLYGRNTFAGSINILSRAPQMDAVEGLFKLTLGAYDRKAYQAVLNLPLSDHLATRLVYSGDKHQGYINNQVISGPVDDLREKDQDYFRAITRFEFNDVIATLRLDHGTKDANSDAIWGYQQIAGYSLIETSPGSGIFESQAEVTGGHIYQPADAKRDDLGPYDVYRNGMSMSQLQHFSATGVLQWQSEWAEYKWTSNYSTFTGKQFFDNDYSDGGLDRIGGFGREDDQQSFSTQLQLSSVGAEQLQWLLGFYYFHQQADWAWLWRQDSSGDGIADSVAVPAWGSPEFDPHRVNSAAIFAQSQFQLSTDVNLVAGLRFNQDQKSFSGEHIGDWGDSAWLYKGALEYNYNRQTLLYASVATGYRTGGANDPRVVVRGAEPWYDNEGVISYELGSKSRLFDDQMHLNVMLFANRYDDVKAQLFAVACNDVTTAETVLQCVESGNNTSFEYYQNGGSIDSVGLEVQWQWQPDEALSLSAYLAWLEAEFSDDHQVGNAQLRPLLGLGNLDGRQDVNDTHSQFSFADWRPAMAPLYTLGLSARYEMNLAKGAYLIAFSQLKYSDDFYAFDTNIPEVKVAAHLIANARLSWVLNKHFQLDVFVNNLTNKAVLTRAVVHSQIVDNKPINSVQANWNDPRTWGVRVQYSF